MDESLYVWQSFDAARDGWPVIAYAIPEIDLEAAPLLAPNPELAEALRPYAEAHHLTTGRPIRLVRYAPETIIELRT